MLDILKAVLFGIIEGITEWLPISSTGHMILLNEWITLPAGADFFEMFSVVIQLGAILAVVILYWNQIFPFTFQNGIHADREKFSMWFKIVFASIPVGVVGILWDDTFHALFYNYQTVTIMLILFGILFLLVERRNDKKQPRITAIADITYRDAFLIGIFQMIAAIFPGTSRSGATILGALLIGISRTTGAEFTFFLAIPAMFGGSAVKLLKFGFDFTGQELTILLVGMIVSFLVSIVVIKFLMSYIKKHDFRAFGWYRIVLGCLVAGYFLLIG